MNWSFRDKWRTTQRSATFYVMPGLRFWIDFWLIVIDIVIPTWSKKTNGSCVLCPYQQVQVGFVLVILVVLILRLVFTASISSTHELLAHSAHSTLAVVRPIYAEWKPVHVASIEHCAAWPSPSWVAKCLGRWRAVTGFELILWSTSRVSTFVLTLHLHPIVKRLTSVKQPGSKTTATLSRTVSFHETSKL